MEEEPIEIIHFHSDGKLAPGLHLSRTDFAASFNRVGVCAAEFPDVTVLAFDIEDTHFHFVLKCLRSRGWRMIALFTKMTHRYLFETREDGVFDGRVVFSEDIVDTDEYCQNVCAYTIIQPTKDGQQIMPFDYPWGSGPLYFRSEKVVPVWLVDRDGKVQTPVTIGSLTSRTRKKWFHTHKSLPDNWLVCNGLILPSNYVETKHFESIFGTYNNYRYCLARANADEVKRRMAKSRGVSLPDIEMRRVCMEKCLQIFHKKKVQELNSMERLELARLLRKQYMISHAQLSRLVHMPLEEIERYI